MNILKVMDLDFAVGQINMGGLRGKVYYTAAQHIDVWPALDADGVTMSTAPTLLSGMRWAEVYTTKDTAGLVDKGVGELDGGSYETELEFFHPKMRVELIQLINVFTNGGFVFIAKDGNGIMRIVGSPELPAYRTTTDANAGKAAKDRNGVSFKFTASSPTPALICAFPISLAPAP
jgi:hypothetical protein